MTRLLGEWGIQKRLNHILNYLQPRDTLSHAEHVGIVVLAGEGGGDVVVAEGGTDTIHLIRGHGHPNTSPADEDTFLRLPAGHLGADGSSEVGVVDGVPGGGAEVVDLDILPSGGDHLDEGVLDVEGGVIAGEGNLTRHYGGWWSENLKKKKKSYA
ncbi:ribose 5-phosphate isomerase B [Angomonas deanei]|nr:ribose 5-phosphate isomerase B [Angomonas deanei]|eukprot:EPY42074.1 ribose 5-phosphate isomerase B [Angomonas deanei]